MTCGVRHVPVFVAAFALATGIGVRAQQQEPRPVSPAQPAPRGTAPARAIPQTEQPPRTVPPSGQTPRPAPQPDRPAQNRETRDTFRAPQGFSVVLVVADLQASTAPDDVPPAARRALTDMKEFLPYKSYKLVDAAWVLGQGMGNTTTRLRGPEEQDYEVILGTGRGDNGRVAVRFTLRDAGATSEEAMVSEVTSANERNREVEKIEREITRLQQKLVEARNANQENVVRDVKSELDAMERRKRSLATSREMKYSPRSARTVIDTSFSMDVGETVVVGTSRMKANSKALIALLTAVPAKGGRTPSTANR